MAIYNLPNRFDSDVRSRPLQSVRRTFFHLSRPEKGLQKRVNLMQQKTNSDLSRHYLSRQLRHLILQEYLSGVKTARQLSEEHGIPMSTIHKMGQRWKAKNSCILQHERSIFLLRSLSRYKLHEIENGILNGLTQ